MIEPRRITRRRTCAVRIVVVLAVVLGILSPAGVLAQGRTALDLVGLYRGFSASDLDPRHHPHVELTIDRQNRQGSFSGTLRIGATSAARWFAFEGRLGNDAAGFALGFEGRGFGRAEEVKLTGTVKILDFLDQRAPYEGALLVRAQYRLTRADGTVDHGATDLLRGFTIPPDPITPVVGTWRWPRRGDLTGRVGEVGLEVRSQENTIFTGISEVAAVDPEPFLTAIVGTISATGRVVVIGAGDRGRLLIAGEVGGVTPDDGLAGLGARYVATFPNGTVDLGEFGPAIPTP